VIRTTPVYANVSVAPVYRSVVERPSVRYSYVEEPTYRYVEEPASYRTVEVRSLEDNVRVRSDESLDCAGSTRSISTAISGLVETIEAVKKIKELLEPSGVAPAPAASDDELLKRLEPKIKVMVENILRENGIQPKPSQTPTPTPGTVPPLQGDERLPDVRSAIEESAAVKSLQAEMAQVRETQTKILQEIQALKNK
jgi:hypothetical protein